MSLFPLHSWRTFFSEQGIQSWQFFSFIIWKCIFHSSLYDFRWEIHYHLSQMSLFSNAFFFLTAFKSFSFSLVCKSFIIYLSVDIFGCSCLGFTELPESIGSCMLPNLEYFQPLFLWIHFKSHSLLSSGDFNDMNISTSVIVQQVPETLGYFSSSIFFYSDWRNSVVLSSSSLILSSVIFILLRPIQWVFNFDYCIFHAYNFHLVLFCDLYFFADVLYFSALISVEFVITHRNIFYFIF